MTASAASESFLPGEGWEIGASGLPERSAARVLLLDHQGRVLLVRGHDAHQVERTWWFTLGGGIEKGEASADAAIREVHEETGLVLEPARLLGPVARRSAIFDFQARSVRQHEVFYAYQLTDSAPQELSTDGWTAIERSFVDEVTWWRLDDLRSVEIEVFPRQLVPLLESVLEGLAPLPPGSPWPHEIVDLGHEVDTRETQTPVSDA